jgi:[acyl-carrier-protein] S-malonyltransferase
VSEDGQVILCPGQGAQAVGMGRAWFEASAAARRTFEQADVLLGDSLGAPLSELCFEGPSERLNDTDVSQPAIYVCSVACYHGLAEREEGLAVAAAAGLSLGEYTALHLAGAFGFEEGLRLVARRGRLMQGAARASEGGMVAIVGADEEQAETICRAALDRAGGGVLVPANHNAPGQIVLSGSAEACRAAVDAATDSGFRATQLAVAGAFHSELMASAAEGMREALAAGDLRPPAVPVWSNVTAAPHDPHDPELLRRRLVEQIVSPVRWSQTCRGLIAAGRMEFDEVAPGNVLRGLMRRIDRHAKVTCHDQP